ncbi:PDDEXK nuclease domain-containing protein [Desulfobacter sp. UBA2225]|uniref:PDDEXK nuclease domain-containing protein n=1 Tax=Desulfobacter sp. UBA2225 TaxID=1961413 RepID=UPI002579F29E|nr:PDDEXK nuclease domain-containing protein [Desulfobacter sp. UBA2225]
MGKKPRTDTNKHELDKTTEHTEVGFDGLVGLFAQTQTAMQTQAARSVDIALVVRNWLFGWYIVEFENGGAERADLYGKKLFKRLSKELNQSGLKGMSETNLRKFREFYQGYAEIQQTLSVTSLSSQKIQQTLPAQSFLTALISETLSRKSDESSFLPDDFWQTLSAKFSLSWSHYVVLLTIDSADERRFYELEATQNAWGIRELKRQINSSLYERLALSRDKAGVKELAQKGQLVAKPSDVLKSPYVLEFLGLQEKPEYSEHDLETAIIDKIEHFLLELGKGFLFEARQKRFTFDDDHFYVDLVFYNRLLRCYVIIDLKRDRLTHQDLGQMQMYVNYFDRYVKLEDEKPTVGILLCHSKDDRLVELTLPKDANIHASAYQLYLPDKEALKKQLEEAQAEWEATHEDSPPVQDQGGITNEHK